MSGAVAEPRVAPGVLRTSPYVGLQPYGEEDAVFFFGREAERKILSANLGASRLTVLYAESGVGKSSVLRAGVASHLRRLAEQNALERGGPRALPVVFSSWPDAPADGLTRAIRDAAAQFGADLPVSSLDETIAAVNERLEARPMIILDQFEEYFRYHAAADDDPFAEQFVTAVNRPDLRAGFIVAIREDALARLDFFQGRIPDLLANYVRMDHLDADAARAAIERPLEVYDAMLAERDDPRRGSVPSAAEPELVTRVLTEVAGGEADRDGGRAASGGRIETPHLQLVLRRLWDEECEAGSTVLRLETLERIGGALRIIETHLDETMATLSEPERDLAAHLFRQFVTPSGTKYAHTISDLVDLTEQPEAEIATVLEKLARPGSQILRAVAPPPGKSDGYRYEITHDVLGTAILDWRRRHEEDAKDRRVTEAEEAAQRERRRARIFRGVMVASLVLLVLAIAAGVLAFVARSQAKDEAELAASSAAGRQASTLLDEKYRSDAALLAALEAYRMKPTFEARRAVLSGLQSDPSLGGVLEGHYWWLNAIASSPNARLIATGSADGTMRLWDTRTRQALGNAVVPDLGEVRDLAFIDDKTLIVSGDKGVSTWDVSKPIAPHRLKEFGPSSTDGVRIAYSPKDETLLIARKNKPVSWWSLSQPDNPVEFRELKPRTGEGFATVAISADGERQAAAGSEGLQLWDFGVEAASYDGKFSAVAFSPDGKTLAAGKEGGGIALYDVENPFGAELQRKLPGHLGAVTSLAFNKDGSLLASTGDENAVLLWDVRTGLPIGGPRTHTDDATAVTFLPDGRFASAGGDGVARLWDVRAPALATTLGTGAGSDNDYLDITAGGLVVAAGDEHRDRRRVRLWKVEDLDSATPVEPGILRDRVDDGTMNNGWTVTAGGNAIAVEEDDGVTIWQARPGAPPKLRRHIAADADTFALDATGTRLAAANEYTDDGDHVEGQISLWDLADLSRKTPLARKRVHTKFINDLAFSPQGGLLASASDDGSVRVLDVSKGRLTTRATILKAHGGQAATAVAFTRDGKTLASGGLDQQIVLWDLSAPGPPRRETGFPPQPNSILSLAFSHDGKVLASGDGNGDVVLWDVERRESLGSALSTSPGESAGGSEAIDQIAFGPSDRYLAAGGRSSPVVVWSSPLWSDNLDTLTKYVCAIVRRNLTSAEWDDFFADTPFADKRQSTCPNTRIP